jgi:DNA repair protein RadC
LSGIPGIGPQRAQRLMAAIELGRRAAVAMEPGRPLMSAGDVADRLARLKSEPVEQFVAISVNARNRVLGEWTVATGWESGVNLTPRQVFVLLMKEGASRVLLAHNHPSGDPTPSPEDVRFTQRLVEAARTLDIRVLDHVIVASGGFASIREQVREMEFG